MFSTRRASNRQMQFRSLFFGLWLGPALGAVLITAIRPMLYGQPFWFDLNVLLRNIGVTYLYGGLIGYPSYLLLVRFNKLHFIGLTVAGTVAGVVIATLCLFANRVPHWLPTTSAMSVRYLFLSAVIVAWSVWFMSAVIELIDRGRGEA